MFCLFSRFYLSPVFNVCFSVAAVTSVSVGLAIIIILILNNKGEVRGVVQKLIIRDNWTNQSKPTQRKVLYKMSDDIMELQKEKYQHTHELQHQISYHAIIGFLCDHMVPVSCYQTWNLLVQTYCRGLKRRVGRDGAVRSTSVSVGWEKEMNNERW